MTTPEMLEQGDDENYADYLWRKIAAPPAAAPAGFELVECTATPRHCPMYTIADDDFYPAPCMYCAYDAAYEAHRGCAHSHHRAWRRWRITGKVAGWLYVTGITSSGGSWQMGGGCNGCRTMPKFNRHPRVYILGVSRDTWRCLLKGRHRPGDPIGFGYCAKCLPCPDCGSKTAGHHDGCPA